MIGRALPIFSSLNAIADLMITHPRTVAALYAKLPTEKLAAIEAMDPTIAAPWADPG